jgi:putative hemolysin
MEKLVGSAVEAFCGPGSPRWASRLMSFGLRHILPMRRLHENRSRVEALNDEAPIADRILEVLDVTYDISDSDQARIPADGPLVVVANHPFGAIEGVILASIIHSVRDDAKIMANHLLGLLGIGELNDALILVDPFDRPGSVRPNVKPLREAIDWVRDGRALGIFPAGEVSHLHLSRLWVRDRQWNNTVARIVRKTEATVLPVYFCGRNSALFNMLGLLHPKIRTLMLLGEAFNKRHSTIKVQIGKPISYKRLSNLEDHAMMDYLRLRTYNLHNRKRSGQNKRLIGLPHTAVRRDRAVLDGKPSSLIAEEIGCLPPEQQLVVSKDFIVFSATAAQIPNALHEIGRLREITFRKAGEGTGKPIDLDRFDEYYFHVFLWNRSREELVGAYRLGPTDSILARSGLRGLYTSTLFEYKKELFTTVGPALELGRSFVRPEYQKTYQPLMLLWSGIGRFVSHHPRYRFLFGAVSINNDYLGISRQIIVEYFRNGHARSDLSALVKGKNQPIVRSPRNGRFGGTLTLVNDIHDLSELISDIEVDEKGIPILLKHYMKLGGQFLGFSVDNRFNKALDALILVDLVRTDHKILERYMGKQGVQAFFNIHGCLTLTGTDSAIA